MKKVLLIPLMATGALFGCQDTNQSQAKDQSVVEQKVQAALWVGSYSGTTPCMGCFSRCDECPGMAVDLVLKQDLTYELRRESLSGHNEVEVLKGRMQFKDSEQTQLALLNVKKRNLIFVDLEHQILEIREDLTAKPYVAQDDFLLEFGKV